MDDVLIALLRADGEDFERAGNLSATVADFEIDIIRHAPTGIKALSFKHNNYIISVTSVEESEDVDRIMKGTRRLGHNLENPITEKDKREYSVAFNKLVNLFYIAVELFGSPRVQKKAQKIDLTKAEDREEVVQIALRFLFFLYSNLLMDTRAARRKLKSDNPLHYAFIKEGVENHAISEMLFVVYVDTEKLTKLLFNKSFTTEDMTTVSIINLDEVIGNDVSQAKAVNIYEDDLYVREQERLDKELRRGIAELKKRLGKSASNRYTIFLYPFTREDSVIPLEVIARGNTYVV